MNNKKIVNFTLVARNNIEDFEDCVTSMVCGGWSLHGYTFISKNKNKVEWFYQAMVLHKEKYEV